MQRSANVLGRSRAAHRWNSAVPGGNLHRSLIRPIVRSAVEVATPAAVESEPQNEAQSLQQPAQASDLKAITSKRSDRREYKTSAANSKDSGNRSQSRSPEALDRAQIRKRCKQLLKGEAVALTLFPNPESVAVCFKEIRSVTKTMKFQSQTLLFFPSTRLVKPQQPKESAEAADADEQQQQQPAQQDPAKDPERQAQTPMLDLALVAVPYFQKPEPEVNIRVGAKSKPDVVARVLTRALLRSSSVAVSAAGPAAALVTLQAAAQARRAIGAQEQLDLAFGMDYRRVSAEEETKPASDEEPAAEEAAEETATPAAATATAAATAAAAAAVPAEGAPAAPPSADGSAAGAAGGSVSGSYPVTVVTQFSFFKRALPTPEVLVSDFAPTLALPAMAQLLTSLISERREVDLLLDSRDALFAVQALARVLRDTWARSKASLGVFLTSLTPDPENDDGERFTARLQLRRIPGAPNLVPTSLERPSLLGAPVGTVKWDSPVGPLAGAMSREWYSAGMFSVLPQEGVCVARALRALWQAQQARAAEAGAGAGAGVAAATSSSMGDDSSSAAPASAEMGPVAAAAAPSTPVFQIAIIPEQQQQQQAQQKPSWRSGRKAGEGGKGERGQLGSAGRVTVLHLLEVSPLLASCLRAKDGLVQSIAGGEQLHQLLKAVMLRNRMYADRRGGKVLTLRPLLDDRGALAVRFQYINKALVEGIPQPPPLNRDASTARPQETAAPAPPRPPPVAEDGYATDDEFGVGAEAAVLVQPAAVAAAAAAASAAGAAGAAAKRQQDAAAAAAGTGSKSPWILFVSNNTSSMRLAMGIVAETCKPYDRRSPVWLRFRSKPDMLATGALAVAMSQAQVQERSNVELLVVPTLERKRDDQNRPYNALVWQLIKYGPGAEPGAAAAAAAAAAAEQSPGPSASAMAAAAAAAAKVQAQGDALISGTRKLW